MRRWQLCLALTLSSVMSAPVAKAATAPGDDLPQVVTGLLVDAVQHPVAGAVQLLAWPTGKPVEPGQIVDLVPVDSTSVAKDGRFSLRSRVTPQLAELANLNGGYVNFVLQATSSGDVQEHHFSRYLGRPDFTAQQTAAESARSSVEWKASPDDSAEAVKVVIPEGHNARVTSGDTRIRPMQGGCWGTKLIETQIRPTVIGELRAPDDTPTAIFTYGKRADSEIGVATRGGQGPWSLSGSFHIGNSQTGEITQRATSGQHLLVRSRFQYDRYEFSCPSGRREKVVARGWMGDYQSEPTAVRGCARAPELHLGRYGPNGSFNRVREKAVQWAGAVDVFGASLTARSGYSQYVRGDWSFGGASEHLLCGDNGPPWAARHIFAGTSA